MYIFKATGETLRNELDDEVIWRHLINSHVIEENHLRNEFDFWKVHGILNTSGLLQSKWSPKEGLHLLCKRPEVFMIPWTSRNWIIITYIYILYYQSSINFKFSPNLAGFPDILN